MSTPFFINQGPIKVSEINSYLNLNINIPKEDIEIIDIKDLSKANIQEITFFSFKKIQRYGKKN